MNLNSHHPYRNSQVGRHSQRWVATYLPDILAWSRDTRCDEVSSRPRIIQRCDLTNACSGGDNRHHTPRGSNIGETTMFANTPTMKCSNIAVSLAPRCESAAKSSSKFAFWSQLSHARSASTAFRPPLSHKPGSASYDHVDAILR